MADSIKRTKRSTIVFRDIQFEQQLTLSQLGVFRVRANNGDRYITSLKETGLFLSQVALLFIFQLASLLLAG